MPTATVEYLGELRLRATHLQSGETFITDAPTDNNGRGEAFSPTDTVATSLATCMLTIMGIRAAKKEVDLHGATANVTKVMASDPRRISKIIVEVRLPKLNIDPQFQELLELAAANCPVAKSLHPDIEQELSFIW